MFLFEERHDTMGETPLKRYHKKAMATLQRMQEKTANSINKISDEPIREAMLTQELEGAGRHLQSVFMDCVRENAQMAHYRTTGNLQGQM